MSREEETVSGPDKAALDTVLNYLKTRNLKETAEVLKKELGLTGEGGLESIPSSSALHTSSVAQSGTEPEKYEDSYASLLEFVERSLDMYRSELALLLYPVFVHLYMDMVVAGHGQEAQKFFAHYHHKQETFYEEELLRLKSITTPVQMVRHELFETFRKHKFTIRISNDSFQCLVKHLQISQNTLILNLINQFLQLDVFDGTPRTRIDIKATSGALDGEASAKANKSKVLYGIPRDPDLAIALTQLEEEESENTEDEKPKKKKMKKDPLGLFSSKKSKAANNPNAPPLNRIPLPKLRECEQIAKFTAYKESAKCVPVGPTSLPSICFYTLLNTSNSLNAVSISDNSSLLAGSFNDSNVRVWTLSPKKLCPLKSYAQLQQIQSLAAEDIMERLIDFSSSTDVRQLVGHSGPVYSTSFSPDNTLLLSASEDGTIRLWSLQTFSALVCFKGHNYPVWSVEFSPMGFYFVSGSHDRSARVWSTDHIQPIRILAGHHSDIDCVKFHPNGNYIATGSSDRSIRLWDVLNGQCVRLLTGHKGAVQAITFSPDGKYMATSGVDCRIIVWDISTASQVCELRGHTDTVYQLAYSRDGTILASGGLDKCVKLWDTSCFDENGMTMNPVHCLLGSYRTKSTPIHSLHFTRKNLLLAAGPYIT